MADLERQSGRGLSRRQREQRAFVAVVVGGGAAVVTVAGVVLALLGVISGTIPFLAAIVAVICLIIFRRTVNG